MSSRNNGPDSGPDVLFCAAGEAIAAHGEDSWYYASAADAALLAVFDGCGGVGSRRYANYSGLTGAYVASRACCGAARQWFEAGGRAPEQLRTCFDRALDVCARYGDKAGRLRGGLTKDFPTTAALVLPRRTGTTLELTCLWAGDSRAYLLLPDGLRQLTTDDTSSPDALSNLSDDGILTNLIAAGRPYELHRRDVTTAVPALVFTATDGCFGYLRTPMEFEFLLLDALCGADSVAAWRQALADAIAVYAGDDFSLCLAGYGFDSFEALRAAYAPRRALLLERYLTPLRSEDGPDPETLWAEYRRTYTI